MYIFWPGWYRGLSVVTRTRLSRTTCMTPSAVSSPSGVITMALTVTSPSTWDSSSTTAVPKASVVTSISRSSSFASMRTTVTVVSAMGWSVTGLLTMTRARLFWSGKMFCGV